MTLTGGRNGARLWAMRGVSKISVHLVIRSQPVRLGHINKLIMFGIANSVLGLISLIVLVAIVLSWRHYFNAAAREARRRARSHGPVVSRRRGPSIRLAVDVNPRNKAKRMRKR